MPDPMTPEDRPRYGSLCSGIGGLDLAVEAYWGATAAWHCEFEEAPSKVLERHWPGVPNLGDLTAVDWSQVEPVEILTAGYPCQPFSHAGRRKGTDDHRHLWPFVADAVRHLRPRWVVLENVAGHLSLGLGDVLGNLAEAGFDAEWCCLPASSVGAPHRRERVFIVAADTRGSGAGRDGRAVPGQAGGARRPGVDVHPAGDAGRLASTNPEGTERQGEPQGADAAALVGAGAGAGARDRSRRAPAGTGRLEPGARVEWGPYRPAIERWAVVLGRPAPTPADDRGRLSPPFVEWMQGFEPGWIDGLTRTQALKALGNAVVQQQALAALCELVPCFDACNEARVNRIWQDEPRRLALTREGDRNHLFRPTDDQKGAGDEAHDPR